MDRPSSESAIVVLRGARTPFGDFGGSLRDVSAVDLGAHDARVALASAAPAGGSSSVRGSSRTISGSPSSTPTTRCPCKRARALGAAPLGRIVSWGVAGVDPDIMGIGPVPASR